jgi:hypothetical protein
MVALLPSTHVRKHAHISWRYTHVLIEGHFAANRVFCQPGQAQQGEDHMLIQPLVWGKVLKTTTKKLFTNRINS